MTEESQSPKRLAIKPSTIRMGCSWCGGYIEYVIEDGDVVITRGNCSCVTALHKSRITIVLNAPKK